MAGSEEAAERLEQAIARLEAAASRASTAAAENRRLGRALAQAQTESTALRATNDAVGARLDQAIGHLKALLGG